ncbi:MAG: hypothetical protein QM757_43290 [Paludibaculum sp.]
MRDLARLSLFDLFDIVKDVPGSTSAQKLLITKSLAHYENLAKEATGDPQILGELAEAYSRLGNLYGNPYSTNIGETEKGAGDLPSRPGTAERHPGRLRARSAGEVARNLVFEPW